MSALTSEKGGLRLHVYKMVNDKQTKLQTSSNVIKKNFLNKDINLPVSYSNSEVNALKQVRRYTHTITEVESVFYPEVRKYLKHKSSLYANDKMMFKPIEVSSKNIPQFLDIVSSCPNRFINKPIVSIKTATKYDHNYVFARVMPGLFGPASSTDDAHGSVVPCYLIPLKDTRETAVYYKIDGVHNMKVSKADSYVISCAYSNLPRHNIYRPVDYTDLFINNIYKREKFTYTREEIRKMVNEAPIPDFAANYHVNVDGDEVDAILSSENVAILCHLNLRQIGQVGKAALIGIIMWYINADQMMREITHAHGLWNDFSLSNFSERAKFLSERAKFLHNVCHINLLQLFEIHTLINRINTKIDWDVEYNNRINPNLAEVPSEHVFNTMCQVFTNKINNEGVSYARMEWKEMWDRRYEWAPSGADFSQYQEDEKYRDSRTMYRSKMISINAMPNSTTLNEFLNRKPECVAKTSVKHEWGKQRAIYGCDNTNFIMFQFAMGKCEEYFDPRFASGKKSRPEAVKAHLKSVLQSSRPLCLDFEDFNSQHSTENMKAVLRAFACIYSKYMTDDQKAAFDWCYRSMDEQIVVDSIGRNQTYKSNGTLFSGWRLTSFMNSALNYCYYSYINPGIREDASAHSGDDIIAGVNRHSNYRDLLYNAMITNIRLSTGKCHYGNISEFLRVDHNSEKTGQYLCRSIATLTFSRIETDPAYNIKDVISAYAERAAACVERGLNSDIVVPITTRALIRKNEIITGNRINLSEVITTSVVCGGLSELRDCRFSSDIKLKSLWELRSLGIVDIKDFPEHTLHGVYSYAGWLKNRFEKYGISANQLTKKLYDTIVTTFAKIPSRIDVIPLSVQDQHKRKILLAIKGAYRSTLKYVEYGRAKTVGRLLEVLENCSEASGLVSVVKGQPDKLNLLNIII